MKNLLFILSLSFLVLFSCSSDSEDEDNNPSILGLWKLVSVVENYNGESIEAITACQQQFNRMDFRENNELFWTQSTDDPSVPINQCQPIVRNYTYNISGLNLNLTNNSNNNSTTTEIEQLTSNTLKIVLFESNGVDNIVWTLNRIEETEEDLIIGTWQKIESGDVYTDGTQETVTITGCAADDRFTFESNGDYSFLRYESIGGTCEESMISENFIDGSWEKISDGNYKIIYSWFDEDTQQTETEISQPDNVTFINENLMRMQFNSTGDIDYSYDDFERVE